MADTDYYFLDNFESDVRPFPITGEYSITATEGYESTRSLTTPRAGWTGSFSIKIKTVAPGTLSFMYKVSSEIRYDFFNFYLDGVRKISYAGISGWLPFTADIAAGDHTLTFQYTKDTSNDVGADRFFIGKLIIPNLAMTTPTLLFTDENKIAYNAPFPTSDTYRSLKVGTITAGQTSSPIKLRAINLCGFDVNNLTVFLRTFEFPYDSKIEISRSNTPFIAEDVTQFFGETIPDKGYKEFYVRVVASENAKSGADYYIYAKADPVF